MNLYLLKTEGWKTIWIDNHPTNTWIIAAESEEEARSMIGELNLEDYGLSATLLANNCQEGESGLILAGFN